MESDHKSIQPGDLGKEEPTGHFPVLLEEILDLASQAVQDCGGPANCSILDGTLGAGGHSLALSKIGAPMILSDRDQRMVSIAKERFLSEGVEPSEPRFDWRCSRASELELAPDLGFALLDLGISMIHLKGMNAGFSYDDDTLDMRLDPELPDSAADLLNNLDEQSLADILFQYGEERASRKIAARIVASRPLESARQLATIIEKAIPGPRKRAHPARKTFQALRIAVNRELQEAAQAVDTIAAALKPGGVLAVITFHSLEDRLIKQTFAKLCGANQPPEQSNKYFPAPEADAPLFEKAIRKSITPSAEEQEKNLASRSARLRAIRRRIIE